MCLGPTRRKSPCSNCVAVWPLLTLITQRGHAVGLHVVASMRNASIIKNANFPVRIAGRVTSIEDARVATGIGGSGAAMPVGEGGRGDFLAVSNIGLTRFQAAFVTTSEIASLVEKMIGQQLSGRELLQLPEAARNNATRLQ